MTYALGLDVGTTFTAAGVWRDGVVEAVGLGNRAHVIPSVLFATDDGALLVGEPAVRRAVLHPARVAREFKRNVGDRVPVRLGDRTFRAEELMTEIARWVLERVAEREGGPPSSVVLTVPATWGGYRQGLLETAVETLGLAAPPTLLEEPVAAALHYASQERIPTGAAVAVYDLGGGTFDATVLRKTDDGFELAGPAQGDDRLGGLDLDQVVLDHIATTLGPRWAALDPLDPATVRSVTLVRAQASEAKEALSADVEVVIPVVLPGETHEIRLTRGEFEMAIEGPLLRSVETLERAVHAAGMDADDLHGVLLVGGSSRIPLVSQLIMQHLGARVALDAHPKYAVCLGAAVVAGNSLDPSADAVLRPAPTSEETGEAALVAGIALAGQDDATVPAPALDVGDDTGPAEDPTERLTPDGSAAATERIDPDAGASDATEAVVPVTDGAATGDGAGDEADPTVAVPRVPDGGAPPVPVAPSTAGTGAAVPPPPPPAPPPDRDGRRRLPALPLLAVAAVIVVIVAVVVWPGTGDGGPGEGGTAAPSPSVEGTTTPTAGPTTATDDPTPTATDTPTQSGTPLAPEDVLTEDVLAEVGPVAWVLSTDEGTVVQVRVGGEPEPVDLVGPAGDGRQPAISPDGSQVAFVSGAAGEDQVVVADLEGGGVSPVAGLPTPSFEPAWSPDGQRLAVTTAGGTGRVVAVLDLDTGGLVQITDGAVFDQRPAWSPDGRLIAFHRIVSGNADIYLVPADGSEAPSPVAATAASESHPTWSPDGRRIAYASLDDGIPAIFVVDVEGGSPERLWPDQFEGQAAPVWTSQDVVVYEGGDRDAEDVFAGSVSGDFVVSFATGPAATNDPSVPAGR